jgi:hypothetical protein
VFVGLFVFVSCLFVCSSLPVDFFGFFGGFFVLFCFVLFCFVFLVILL